MALKRQVSLDTETTGKSDDGTPGNHRIIEIGCVEIIGRKIQNHEFHVILDPEREVDPEAAKVHGMTWDMLRGKPKFKDIVADFMDFITGTELLIHNARFDVGFLNHELDLMGYGMHIEDVATVTDTIEVARQNPDIHIFNLDYLCRHFSVNNSQRVQHGALLDAQLLAEVYLAMTGGQVGLNLQENVRENTNFQRWKRPRGFTLPLMPVEKSRHVLHVDHMISLAQAVKFKTENEQDFAGSAWGEEYTMPYLEKGKEESKGAYKKRLKEQKTQKIEQLLSAEEREELTKALQHEQDVFQHWEDRVMGRVPQ